MSLTDVVSRMNEIESLAARATAPAATADTGSGTGFRTALTSATSTPTDGGAAAFALLPQPASAVPAVQLLSYTTPADTGPGAGLRTLAAAEGQVGVSEEPPGSNDGPQLATYRSAVAGAAPGEPWCAYFASWAAAQAGAPLGDAGQGLGSVAQITDWAAGTGRLLPASATPSPGDLILFGDRHVGIVESVGADGSLTTVEGNYGNAVTRVRRSPAEATGYVRL